MLVTRMQSPEARLLNMLFHSWNSIEHCGKLTSIPGIVTNRCYNFWHLVLSVVVTSPLTWLDQLQILYYIFLWLIYCTKQSNWLKDVPLNVLRIQIINQSAWQFIGKLKKIHSQFHLKILGTSTFGSKNVILAEALIEMSFLLFCLIGPTYLKLL